MSTIEPLVPGNYYHIFNRGNNRENLFQEGRNYAYFLELYQKHLSDVVQTFAYCLMPNHFHFLIKIIEVERISGLVDPSQRFSNFFNAYTKTINKGYSRTGSLFQKQFGRRLVQSDGDFQNLIFYIHHNPQKHGFVSDFRDWKWSSYYALRSHGKTRLERQIVINWFDGIQNFEAFHTGMVDERKIQEHVEDDFFPL